MKNVMDFEVNTQYTLDEQRQFHRAVSHRKTSLMIAAAGIAFMTGLDIYFAVKYGMWILPRLLPYTLAYIAFMIFFLWFLERNSVKAWKTKELTKDAVVNYHFTSDYVEVKSAGSEGIYTYDKFSKLIETRTHFYLMLSANMGFAIRKDVCTDEQQAFIKEKCVGRKKLRKMGLPDSMEGIRPQMVPDDKDLSAESEKPLYTTKVKYTLKEYLKYNAVLVVRNMRVYAMLAILLVLIMIRYYIRDGIYGLQQGLIVYAVAVVIAFLIFFFLVCRSWKKNTLMKNSEEYYRFYTDRLEVVHSVGRSVIPYDKIYKIIETGQNFYIMVGQGQGLILCKSECSDELIRFMKEKKAIVARK